MCTVSAGPAAALVQPLLAVGAGEAVRAAAAVAAANGLQAGSPVEARPVCAPHGADLTVPSVETLRTRAGIPVQQILQEDTEEKPVSVGTAGTGGSVSVSSCPTWQQ